LWFNFTIKGILCAYLLEWSDRTPKVEATALQPPSMASLIMFSGSKYSGFGAKALPTLCSISGWLPKRKKPI